ncbi:uncharacterized protein LOC117009125 isoform X4 [Catharus ustulatus]|uniref:uncharacterized protein LOC117009125 isoform X4 n=1 Tax=Catharus ustulatus TaxID=91951 RepID=UPI00140A339B|nr:uncharacterized protein LOC117009125 isoform X4 [Catharus ustulatus]
MQLSPGWRWSSHSSTPHPSPTQSVTAQPRRQLSSQVVSRLSSLEPPWSRSTPGWQVGVAYRDSGTPLASSMGFCSAAGEGLALPVGSQSTAIKDKQGPLKGSEAPAPGAPGLPWRWLGAEVKNN